MNIIDAITAPGEKVVVLGGGPNGPNGEWAVEVMLTVRGVIVSLNRAVLSEWRKRIAR